MNVLNSPRQGTRKTVVVMVHGTFVKGGISGTDWWQTESQFWSKLRSILNLDDTLLEMYPFKWSGDNSAQERLTAACKLLAYLRLLEQEGTPYHIIAHSHGGIVVWNALKFSLAPELAENVVDQKPEKGELRLLRSWVTVGTPFLLHKRPHRLLKNSGQENPIVDVLLPIAAMFSAYLYIAANSPRWFRKYSPLRVPYIIQLSLRLELMRHIFIAIVRLFNRFYLHRDVRSDKDTVNAYAARWLGIWCDQDEALAGLKSTFLLSGQIVPRLTKNNYSAKPKLPIALSRFTNFVTPLRRVYMELYDRVIAPRVDAYLWSQLKNTAQGNDRLGVQAESVNSAPTTLLSSPPPLVKSATESLRQMADSNLQAKVPFIRKELLGSVVATDGLVISKAMYGLTGDELVHCLYFQAEEMPLIIGSHIHSLSEESERSPMAPLQENPNLEVEEYLKKFKSHLDTCLQSLKECTE